MYEGIDFLTVRQSTLLTVLSHLQVVTYLLAHKLMSPGKFTLLRGNHETRLQNCHSGCLPSPP